MSLHVRMCACLRLRATLLLACVPCAYVSWCVCACVRVFQESQWLDSVSLLIQDTLEGEMLMIDNLSGSVFHHYSSPPVCKDCKGHLQEVPPPPTLLRRAGTAQDGSHKISSLSLSLSFGLFVNVILQLLPRHQQLCLLYLGIHFIPCVPMEPRFATPYLHCAQIRGAGMQICMCAHGHTHSGLHSSHEESPTGDSSGPWTGSQPFTEHNGDAPR